DTSIATTARMLRIEKRRRVDIGFLLQEVGDWYTGEWKRWYFVWPQCGAGTGMSVAGWTSSHMNPSYPLRRDRSTSPATPNVTL
ncbi:MAG: hypothetical protein MUC51_07870, partial [Anaerolineae bacterium]|nr:hypothetical protein [Anaerolineae bacterium]